MRENRRNGNFGIKRGSRTTKPKSGRTPKLKSKRRTLRPKGRPTPQKNPLASGFFCGVGRPFGRSVLLFDFSFGVLPDFGFVVLLPRLMPKFPFLLFSRIRPHLIRMCSPPLILDLYEWPCAGLDHRGFQEAG